MITQKNSQWIETVNSYGPFTHSPWKGNGISVSHEEGLEGRADFLAKELRKLIVGKFTHAQLKKLSIIDVGCYDGWILHQLSDLPFKKLVGIEPRNKNLLKGEGIRRLLGIKTRVQFRVGSLENIGKEKFDIVLCIGVLHHVESIAIAIRNLDSITKRMLVIDTICLPEKYLTATIARDLELKDIIYQNKQKRFGLTGEKYESAYYDGSTSHVAVVGIPSPQSLIMNMDILGYSPIKIVANQHAFRKAMKKNMRPFEEILISGMKTIDGSKDEVVEYIKKYEHALIHDNLDGALINELFGYFVENKRMQLSPLARQILSYIKDGGDGKDIQKYFKKSLEWEIIKNMKYNPRDKVAFEYAKKVWKAGDGAEAIRVLKSITQTLNADWRTVYRSFYLLHLIYTKGGNHKEGLRYAMLCKRCHINFPLL